MKTVALIKKCNSWSSFQSLLEACNNKEKGDAFELLTKLYFKLNPIYDFYDEVWLLDEVPQKDLDVLKLPSQDLGIDLIAKNGSEYHAIQCKYHSDKNQNVTFTEVSTFLQLIEANKKITLGYICSSANGMSKNYHKVQKKQVQEILVDTWQKLDGGFFDKARKLLLNKRVKDKPLTPYKHQKKAIKGAKKHFLTEDNDRGKLIFPCGSGKSLTGYWITEALGSNSTLIAVPSLSLVKQTLEVYLREIVAHEINVKWLCICSDEGIGKDSEVLVKTQDIGVPCLTDVDYISNWLEEHRNDKTIIFTTYQSGRIIAEVSKRLKFKFDVGIFDEAHKTVGSKNKVFSHLLLEENIDIKNRIFMTATERFYRGRKDEIISMDEIGVYGETFAYLSFKEAIEQELLTDYKVITIDIKKSEIADFIKENNLVQLDDKWKKDTEARSLASMLAMRKAMKRFDIKNVLSFHSSIEKAKRYKDLQGYITKNYNYKPIDAYTVSGKIPTAKRNNIVQEFANSKRSLITNARCLTEGIDVPNIDCIVFADPKRSQVDIVQALGRALRKKEGKDWGYVILPIVYNEETNEIDNDSFNEIVSIVSSLATNDERIIEYFKAKNQKGKTNRDIIKGSDVFSFDSSMLDEKDFARQLEIKIWNKLSKFKWIDFESAKNYAISLGLHASYHWVQHWSEHPRPNNIPIAPNKVYKNDWKGWGDFLGSSVKSNFEREYLSFNEALKYVHSLKLKSNIEWREWSKESRPDNIPSRPSRTYKNEWKDWGHWLGTYSKYNLYSYNECKRVLKKLGITNNKEFRKLLTENIDLRIPRTPNKVYKNEWKGWEDLFGKEKKHYKSYEEQKSIVGQYKFKSGQQFLKYIKKHGHILGVFLDPAQAFKDKQEWKGWQEFLGYSLHPKKKSFLSYTNARRYIETFSFTTAKEYRDWSKTDERPGNIPSDPRAEYINKGWKGWEDFLNSNTYKKRFSKYLLYKDAQTLLSKLNIKTSKEFAAKKKSGLIPKNIPSNPLSFYSEWTDWYDFLGTEKRKIVNYDEAKKIAKDNNINSHSEWRDFVQLSERKDLRSNLTRTYNKSGWKGSDEFFDKKQ